MGGQVRPMFAMITVTIKMPTLDEVTKELLGADGIDKMLRECAVVQQTLMHERVHNDGQDSFGRQIGTYTDSYMKVRTQQYNRNADRKVILSLTRQMENALSVVDTGTGWGVGYRDMLNYNKAKGQEKNYKKPIWLQTETEEEATRKTVNKYIDDALRR